MTPRTIHPTFYPDSALWRCQEPRVSAPSLRELKAKLGPGYKIKDYFPSGDYRPPPRPNGDGSTRVAVPNAYNPEKGRQAKITAARSKEAVVAPPTVVETRDWDIAWGVVAMPPVKNVNNRKYDWEAVLDLWAAGWTGPAIGEKLGLAASTTAGGIVSRHRIDHPEDPRTVRRASKR